MEDIIETDKKHENIQYRIGPAAGCITEGKLRHKPFEGWVKEINKSNDVFFQHWFLG